MSSVFYPQYSFIQSITQGVQTIVIFTDDCDFTPGEIVSFRVSPPNGMVELNNVATLVLSNTDDSITVDIDSRNFTPFVYTDQNLVRQPAMVVPAGSGIVPNSYPRATSLVDAFDNIPLN